MLQDADDEIYAVINNKCARERKGHLKAMDSKMQILRVRIPILNGPRV